VDTLLRAETDEDSHRPLGGPSIHLEVRGCPSLTVRPFVLGPDALEGATAEEELAEIAG
jgi:hypothetical protein